MNLIPKSVYRYTDREMTWAKAVLLCFGIWVLAIVLLGQIPSVIIYTFDQYIAQIIDFSKKVPGVNPDGLNTIQIKIIRDIVANGVQMGFLTAMIGGAYFWQKAKQKRTGAKGLTDVVKGYMPGK